MSMWVWMCWDGTNKLTGKINNNNRTFSPRFDCVNRTYKYFFYGGNLDIERMRTAGKMVFKNIIIIALFLLLLLFLLVFGLLF